MQITEETYLTIDDLSKYLNIKKRTLYYYVEILEIPHYRLGKSGTSGKPGKLIRFKKSEIDEWLKLKRQLTFETKNNFSV